MFKRKRRVVGQARKSRRQWLVIVTALTGCSMLGYVAVDDAPVPCSKSWQSAMKLFHTGSIMPETYKPCIKDK